MSSPSVDDLYAILHGQMLHTIGLLLGTLLTGVLFALGVSSVFVLSAKAPESLGRKMSKQDYFLRAYVIILMISVLILDIEGFVSGNYFTIFSSHTPQAIQQFLWVCGKVLASTSLAVSLLANGILVWRCYMVQRVLGPYTSSKWGNTLWAFPACLWIITLATGIIAAAMPDVHNTVFPGIPGTIEIASNSLLIIYATIFLTTRLLAHRKMIKSLLGDKVVMMPHLCIITVLLESAAINVPIAIAAAVGLGSGRVFGEVMGLISPPSQALASVIIIQQVALGSSFCQRRDMSRLRLISGGTHSV